MSWLNVLKSFVEETADSFGDIPAGVNEFGSQNPDVEIDRIITLLREIVLDLKMDF